jgi:hypothetical protein
MRQDTRSDEFVKTTHRNAAKFLQCLGPQHLHPRDPALVVLAAVRRICRNVGV